MKKLSKKQILIITLLCISAIVVISIVGFLINNTIETLPVITQLKKQGDASSLSLLQSLYKAIALNIFFQCVLLFIYALALWFGIGYCKKLGKKED